MQGQCRLRAKAPCWLRLHSTGMLSSCKCSWIVEPPFTSNWAGCLASQGINLKYEPSSLSWTSTDEGSALFGLGVNVKQSGWNYVDQTSLQEYIKGGHLEQNAIF